MQEGFESGDIKDPFKEIDMESSSELVEPPRQLGFTDKSPELSEIDRELEEILKKQSSKVKVFGVGGAGGNTVTRMKEIGIKGGEFITANTDAQDLLYTNADHKMMLHV